MRANAGLDSLVPRFYLRAKQHVDELFITASVNDAPAKHERPDPSRAGADAQGILRAEPERAPTPLPWRSSADEQAPLAAANQATWKLLEQRRLDPERDAAHGSQRQSSLRVSRTDPDAAMMRMKGGGPLALGDHDHYVVDGGKHRMILQALVTPADVMENTPMLDLLWRVCFRWQLRPKRAIGDTTYGTAENIRALEQAGIHAYVPLPNWDERTPYFGPSTFTYDAEWDVYRCPQGHPLRWDRRNYAAEVDL